LIATSSFFRIQEFGVTSGDVARGDESFILDDATTTRVTNLLGAVVGWAGNGRNDIALTCDVVTLSNGTGVADTVVNGFTSSSLRVATGGVTSGVACWYARLVNVTTSSVTSNGKSTQVGVTVYNFELIASEVGVVTLSRRRASADVTDWVGCVRALWNCGTTSRNGSVQNKGEANIGDVASFSVEWNISASNVIVANSVCAVVGGIANSFADEIASSGGGVTNVFDALVDGTVCGGETLGSVDATVGWDRVTRSSLWVAHTVITKGGCVGLAEVVKVVVSTTSGSVVTFKSRQALIITELVRGADNVLVVLEITSNVVRGTRYKHALSVVSVNVTVGYSATTTFDNRVECPSRARRKRVRGLVDAVLD